MEKHDMAACWNRQRVVTKGSKARPTLITAGRTLSNSTVNMYNNIVRQAKTLQLWFIRDPQYSVMLLVFRLLRSLRARYGVLHCESSGHVSMVPRARAEALPPPRCLARKFESSTMLQNMESRRPDFGSSTRNITTTEHIKGSLL